MKALRTITTYPPGSLMNPAFKYRRACETDVRKTIERERARLAKAAVNDAQMALPVGRALASVKGGAA